MWVKGNQSHWFPFALICHGKRLLGVRDHSWNFSWGLSLWRMTEFSYMFEKLLPLAVQLFCCAIRSHLFLSRTPHDFLRVWCLNLSYIHIYTCLSLLLVDHFFCWDWYRYSLPENLCGALPPIMCPYGAGSARTFPCVSLGEMRMCKSIAVFMCTSHFNAVCTGKCSGRQYPMSQLCLSPKWPHSMTSKICHLRVAPSPYLIEESPLVGEWLACSPTSGLW